MALHLASRINTVRVGWIVACKCDAEQKTTPLSIQKMHMAWHAEFIELLLLLACLEELGSR